MDDEHQLDQFEQDILEDLIAGKLKTEVVVGDGSFARSLMESLRDRAQPQSVLEEIDRRSAERHKDTEES